MSKAILIRGARQLLTLRGSSGPRRGVDLRNLGIIHDGAILIADGLVREVGPSRRVENLAASRSALDINAGGRVVLPGFVDSHTHLVSGPVRALDYEMLLAGASRVEMDAAGGGFAARWREMQSVSTRALDIQAHKILEDCAAHGTTTLEAKSGCGLTEAAEMKILRAGLALDARPVSVVSTFLAGRVVPDEFSKIADYRAWLCSYLLPLIGRRRLAEFADVYCEEGAFTAEEARHYLACAKECGLIPKMHTGQYSDSRGVRAALELEAASVDHLVHLHPGDAALLARSQTVATLLPGSSFHLGSRRYAPARELIDRGAAVALATNYNPDTCPSHNMQMMLSLACRNMQMTPAETISAATINGAYALHRGHRIGSLEFGKRADLIVLGVSDYREIPQHFGVNLVEMTMRSGQIVYQKPEVKWPAR